MGDTQRVKRQAYDSQSCRMLRRRSFPTSKRHHSTDDTNSHPAAMPLKLGQLSLMMTVMPVNPDAMMIPPSPMSRHPIPSIPAFPIPRPVAVVRAVADFNKDSRGRRRWRECARANESAQHDQKISFHPFSLNRKWTCVGLGIFRIYRRDYTGASARCSLGSIHLPCSRIKSCNRPTASASGILNFTGVLPT
jgi:hypothetical protein